MSATVQASTLQAILVSSQISFTLIAPANFPNSGVAVTPNQRVFSYGSAIFSGNAAFGTNAGQLQYAYQNTLVITNSAPVTLQLSASGSLLDLNQNPTPFNYVGQVWALGLNTSGQTLTVAPAASNGVSWPELPSGGLAYKPNTPVIIQDANSSMPVAAGSADKLAFSVNTGTLTVFVSIVGR